METILDKLEQRAAGQADQVFLSEGNRRLTFADFAMQVRRCAGLFQEHGIKHGDRVVLHVSGRTSHLAAYMAAMRIGSIPVHLYAERTVEHVAATVRYTSAALVVTDQERADWESFSHPIIHLPDLADAGLPQARPGRPNQVAYMMLTSGTTGTPKPVMTTHENILCVTQNLIRLAQMTDEERELIVMPLGSTGGLGHFHANLWLGNYTELAPYFFGSMTDADMVHLLDTIESERITGLLSTPGMLGELATTHRKAFRDKARHVRYVLANVCPIRHELVSDLMKLLPATRFCTYYGLTEASRSVGHCYNDNPDKISAAGKPLDGVEIKVDRPDVRGAGEVLIRGRNVTIGYWGRDDALDREGWLHTGDIGVVDDDGFLTIRGRLRDNINVDGLKFFPRDVEDILVEHSAIVDCAVVGLPHPVKFQQPVAAIVGRENTNRDALRAELETYCTERLEFYKRPTQYIFVDSIPRSGLGKTRRDALIKMIESKSGVSAS